MTAHPTLTARIDVTLLRGQNNREHHRVRAARVAAERLATLDALDDAQWSTDSLEVLATLCEDDTGARVTLVRPYQVTPLDCDNLSASFKSVRDAVARYLLLDDASDRLHWVYRQVPAVVLGRSKKAGRTRASTDRDTRPTVLIEVMPVDRIDPQAEALAQAEAREWALGVQVVAQAQRLRLAEAVCDAARGLDDTAETRQLWDALADWDAVPGDVDPVDLG
jgi:hypothetical protein